VGPKNPRGPQAIDARQQQRQQVEQSVVCVSPLGHDDRYTPALHCSDWLL
jgi:hypothetical protein